MKKYLIALIVFAFVGTAALFAFNNVDATNTVVNNEVKIENMDQKPCPADCTKPCCNKSDTTKCSKKKPSSCCNKGK